jgi:predicted glutamine amidotransferase
MCKVLIIPGIKHAEKTALFAAAMGQRMTIGNSDGLGYAAIDESGKLFGERWWKNEDAFLQKEAVAPLNPTMASWGKALRAIPSASPTSNKFGVGTITDAKALTLHTRMATCEKSLRNVHPFVDESLDTSVIHNGVIRNQYEFNLKLSTCDSESILISYLENGVNTDITAAQEMANSLQGYYACGVFSRDASGNRILDVFKFNNNNLVIVWINELDTYVLTSSMLDVESVCRQLKMTHGKEIDVMDNFITRINPLTGEVIEQYKFDSPHIVPTATYYPTAKYSGYQEFKPTAHKVNNEMVRLWSLPSNIREIHEP